MCSHVAPRFATDGQAKRKGIIVNALFEDASGAHAYLGSMRRKVLSRMRQW